MNRCFQRLLIWPAVCLLGACASVLNDAEQTVMVRTDCPRAVLSSTCTASVGGQVFRFETPATFTLPRSTEPVWVQCHGGLLGGTQVDVRPGISAGVLGNALLGGAVGVVIDFNTPRAFAYPHVTNIVMPLCAVL